MRTNVDVLLVDDDPVLRCIASEILGGMGFRVVEAADGRGAIAALSNASFALMMIDMLMPEKEGAETIMEVKARWPSLKIIAISGGGLIGTTDLLQLARLIGADATLEKPLSVDKVRNAISRIFADDASALPLEFGAGAL